MDQKEIDNLSTLALAHVGDGVYELLVRTRLARQGISRVNDLHRATVALVKASAQAQAVPAACVKAAPAAWAEENPAAWADRDGESA